MSDFNFMDVSFFISDHNNKVTLERYYFMFLEWLDIQELLWRHIFFLW